MSIQMAAMAFLRSLTDLVNRRQKDLNPVNMYCTRDLNPKIAADAGVLFTLSAHFCTCWYYPLYFIHF